MKIYQLHLNGKERAHHNFKSIDEAIEHQRRLIVHCKDRISEGQLGFRAYLKEAKNLEVVEIEKIIRTQTFSVCEYGLGCVGIVKHFHEYDAAENFMKRIQEDSKRIYSIMESNVND